MKKKILLVATTIGLVMSGCVQKQLHTIDDGNGAYGNSGSTERIGTITGGGSYQNVDPMGQGMSQGNGVYGEENGMYTNESGIYANSGVQNIYFDVNQYHITANKLGQVSHNSKLLSNSNKVKVEGHCDASGSDEYNYALGLRRAKAAKEALIINGVSASKITLVSMGEAAPECVTSSSSDCYAKNRRVEFKVIQ